MDKPVGELNGTYYGWNPGNGTRGTWDILQICLLTILACTWNILLFEVPLPDESKWKLRFNRLAAFVVAVLVPEIIFAEAVSTLTKAREIYKACNPRDPVQNKLSFARDGDSMFDDASELALIPTRGPRFTLEHAYTITENGIHVAVVGSDSVASVATVAENWGQMSDFIRGPLNYIDFTKEEIKDKSKVDLFARLAALVQIATIVCSVVYRWYQRRPIAPLEILTLSFAAQAIATYAVQWRRPSNIGTPFVITIPGEINKACRIGPATPWPEIRYNRFFIILFAAITVVSSVHLFIWTYDFPTKIESTLWKIGAIATVLTPILAGFALELWKRQGSMAPLMASCAAYVLGRLALIALAFSSLRQVPIGLYEANFSQYIPSVQ